MASEQELADMERMSNDYIPDVQVLSETVWWMSYPNSQARDLWLEPNSRLKH